MNVKLLFILALFPLSAVAGRVGDGTACNMPAASFKFSYLTTLVNTEPKPVDQDFFSSSTNDMDVVKAQVFLWYVYENKKLSPSFFSKVGLRSLVQRDNDSINSILWLMKRDKGYFPKLSHKDMSYVMDQLDSWKERLASVDSGKNWLLDVYEADSRIDVNIDRPKQAPTNDVDILLQLGVLSEQRGRKLEALYYYTKVAEMGYQPGLVGASLLLPQLGGQQCVSRAAYYVLLSGAAGGVKWITK